MRLTRLETIPYALPFREPYVTARGRLERRELLLVRLHGEDGVAGLGEAAPLALRGGPGLGEIERELRERLWPVLREASVGSGGTADALTVACAATGCSRQALAAVDLALHDLAGKVTGEPAWRLFGAGEARPVRCNATLAAGEPAEVARRAAEWAARGFTTFKLKLGTDGDAEQVAAVREAVGPEARIRIDANGAWSLEAAERKLAELEPLGIELAEQPVASLEEMAELRRRTSIPLAADESVVHSADADRAVAMEACDMATVKLAKSGGMFAAKILATSIPVYLSSALDGPLGIAAAAHAAQTLPRSGPAAGLAHGLATAELFEGTVAAAACELDGAWLTVPDRPGLGVEIDEAALERHRL